MTALPRKTAKIFASAAGGSGVAVPGSTAGGTPAFSTDLATLQSTAFVNGLASMVIAGTKRLEVYEEANAVDFVLSSQIAYILERGLPEYDSATEYNITDIVRKPSTYELYGSIGNANLGNALPSAVTNANWQYLGTLANLGNVVDGDKGDITVSSSGTVWTIDNNAVSLAKLATQAANSFLANATASSAVPTAVTMANSTAIARSASGNIAAHTLSGLTASGGVLSAKYVQEVAFETGAVATGTTAQPFDDTKPQITEGDLYLTAPPLTPTDSTAILEIEMLMNVAFNNSAANSTAALYRDSGTDAVAAVAAEASTNNGCMTNLKLTHRMVAGSTTATVFTGRSGNSTAGTTTFNGALGARIFGGVMASSIIVRQLAP